MQAVITGASRGFGLELARILAQRGWKVAALNREESDEFNRLTKQFPEKVTYCLADVSSETSVKTATARLFPSFGTVDLLINNAGIQLDKPPKDLLDYDFEAAKEMFAVNALGVMIVMKHFLPLVRSGSGKRIVNVTSEAGSVGKSDRVNMYGYCMSKAAANMGSKIVQNSVAQEGIQVLVVNPGWLKTKMGGDEATDDPHLAALELLATLEKPLPVGSMYIERDGRPLLW